MGREKSSRIKLRDSYSGWLIELIPLSEGYVFKCWTPDEQIGISNNHAYPGLYQALKAARKRVKLESASLIIIDFLNEYYKNCNLSAQEHKYLINSILDFTTSTSKPGN